MGKKKILWIIPVSDQTYSKWQKIKYGAKKAAGPLAFGATIGAIWSGYISGISNGIAINKLQKKHDRLEDIVFHNANCSQYDRERIDNLEEQQKTLMDEALRITEGKKEGSAA